MEYNRGIITERITMDKKPELSDAEKRVREIAKECGLKRII